MFNTRKHTPLSSAVAGATVMRVAGSLGINRLRDMAHRTASFPIYCSAQQ
jgi:hypothetical protein